MAKNQRHSARAAPPLVLAPNTTRWFFDGQGYSIEEPEIATWAYATVFRFTSSSQEKPARAERANRLIDLVRRHPRVGMRAVESAFNCASKIDAVIDAAEEILAFVAAQCPPPVRDAGFITTASPPVSSEAPVCAACHLSPRPECPEFQRAGLVGRLQPLAGEEWSLAADLDHRTAEQVSACRAIREPSCGVAS